MTFRYFKDSQGGVHGFDQTQLGDVALMETLAIAGSWSEVTSSWPPAPALADLQAQQISLIEAAYSAAVTEPVTFITAGGVTQTFQADLNSQMILVKSQQGFAIAGAVPQGFYWVAADNTQVPFTLADLKGLYGAMLAQGWSAFQHLQMLKATIRAATTAAAVSSTTW